MLSLFRPIIRNGRNTFCRYLSTDADSPDNLIKLEYDDRGFTVVSMNNPPVNSLGLDFLSSLHSTLSKLEKGNCKGMVLTSEFPTVFSAGLDIMEMYKPDLDRARKFWTMLQETWMKLYTIPFPTVAAINGHSPAGGCMLAMSCEYRIMVAPKFTIGLNETQLGIVAPQWFQDLLKNVIGVRQAELALVTGKLFPVDEALKIGLVDATASSREEAIKKAKDFLEEQTYLPPLARQLIKVHYRKSTTDWLTKNREKDIKTFLDFIVQPKVQKGLEMYLASLKKK